MSTGGNSPLLKLIVIALALFMISFLAGCANSPGTTTAPASAPAKQSMTTYCNPLSIPNYPVGRLCRDIHVGEPAPEGLWLQDRIEQYRELADPSVLYFDGQWYLYPSCDMAWVSSDNGATWAHHPLNIRDVGYAPTIVHHRDRFLLLASDSDIYSSDSPLGPFVKIGKIELPKGLPEQVDPMLFSDDNGRLFYYWGCSPTAGIYACELDPDHPSTTISIPKQVIPFEPEKFPWQSCGEWNEKTDRGWIEGSWMFKRNGVYYLTYSAAGTENRTYAVGCSTSNSPLGPFKPQKNNPILRRTDGLVTGTAHGCIVEGQHNSLWAFYTIRAGHVHGFERRIGMDPAFIGDDGELHVAEPSSIPMLIPTETTPAKAAGWLPINTNARAQTSSSAPNLSGRFTVDEDLRTYWQPDADDKSPTLTTTWNYPATVNAIRIAWRDVGLNTKAGVNPGPFRYKIELETANKNWITAIDRSSSTEDLLIDYRTCEPTQALAARLVIVGAPSGITPGVAEFTVFGKIVKK